MTFGKCVALDKVVYNLKSLFTAYLLGNKTKYNYLHSTLKDFYFGDFWTHVLFIEFSMNISLDVS